MVAVLHEIGAPSHSTCIGSYMIRAERAAELADQVSSKRRLQVWMFKLQASSLSCETDWQSRRRLDVIGSRFTSCHGLTAGLGKVAAQALPLDQRRGGRQTRRCDSIVIRSDHSKASWTSLGTRTTAHLPTVEVGTSGEARGRRSWSNRDHFKGQHVRRA